MRDVVVVGGGPAGSAAAAALAKDRDVLVIEEHGKVGSPVQCAGLVTEDSIALSGIDPLVLNSFRGADVVFPSGKTVTVRSKGIMAVMIDRMDFDEKLAAAAMDAGAEYIYSTRCRSYSVRNGIATVDAGADSISTKLVIGADGHSSKIASSIPDNMPKEYLRGIEYDIRKTMDVQDMVTIRIGVDIAPGLFTWEAPFGEYTRVGLCCSSGAGLPIDYMKVLLKRAGLQDREIVAKYCGKIPLGRKRRTYGENMMLIGDAASQVKPVSGGGIYPAMKCVGHLKRAADIAFGKDDFSERVLSVYEKCWRPDIGRSLDRAYSLRKIYTSMNNEDMDSIYGHMKNEKVNELLNVTNIDRPDVSMKQVLYNLPTALKIASLAIRAKVRR